MGGLPQGISVERNLQLRTRSRGPWIRRLLLCAIALVPTMALLGVFGQHPTTSSAASPAAAVAVTAPTRLRSGLIFQARVQVDARRTINQLQISFDRGWWESMSVNSIEPNPSNESSDDGRVVLSYGRLPAGRTLISWLYFQVNPTNVGKRSEDVVVSDGPTPLVRVYRSMTIFP
jgi:hypothetical protein